jgi:uncharacterized protein YybS (DUF2232 family)
VPLSNNQIRLWIILTIIMGGLTVTPFALLGLLFIGVPMLVLKLAHVNKWVFGGTVAVAIAIPAILLGSSAWPIVMWIFFLILPINWMLTGYKRSTSAKLPLTYGTIGIVFVFFLILIAAMNLYPHSWTNFTSDLHKQMADSNELLKLGMHAQDIQALADLAVQMIPAVLVIGAMAVAGMMHTIARRVFKLYRILLPELNIADEWRVPKSWVVLYALAFVTQFSMKVGDQSFLALAVNNLVPLLSVALSIQTFGMLHFISRTKKWVNVLKVVAALLVLPMTVLVVVFGILDTLLPLRERFTKQEG